MTSTTPYTGESRQTVRCEREAFHLQIKYFLIAKFATFINGRRKMEI